MLDLNIVKMSFKEIKLAFEEKKCEINGLPEGEYLILINQLLNDKRKNVNALGLSMKNKLEKEKAEVLRIKGMYNFDKSFSGIHIAGVDEVGRGPLAGPIVAASVIMNINTLNDKDLILGVKDSKKLSKKHREELSEIIKNKALSYNIHLIGNDEIDRRGIAWCNNEVLKKAVLGLKLAPDFVISDGYLVKNLDIPSDFVIKGDAKSFNIACASIIAKVYRDNLMDEYAKIYPQYGFENHAGYGTKEHMEAIFNYGPCKIHRISFLKNLGY